MTAAQLGAPITDTRELLHRAIRQIWAEDNKVSSQNFKPMPNDHGLLSVNQASKADAATTLAHAQNANLAPVAVMSVSLDDVTAAGLSAHEDPVDGNPAHAVLNFTALDRKGVEKAAKKLRAAAFAHAIHPAGLALSY